MPRIVKRPGEEQDIRPFDFFAGFRIDSQPEEEEETEEEEDKEEAEEDDGFEEELAALREEILSEANAEAKKIISDARSQAEYLREQGYREGQEEGRQDGFREAYEEQRRLLDAEVEELHHNAVNVIESVSLEKNKLLEQYVDDLKRISLAVAEKIIQTSLQSSGEVVKRMILAATDKITKKQWAKIYITKCDTVVAMDMDAEFLEKLAGLSENIKIITMDNGEDGTCIIELPDEIIDASVGTQLENIKDILNNVRV